MTLGPPRRALPRFGGFRRTLELLGSRSTTILTVDSGGALPCPRRRRNGGGPFKKVLGVGGISNCGGGDGGGGGGEVGGGGGGGDGGRGSMPGAAAVDLRLLLTAAGEMKLQKRRRSKVVQIR